MPPLCCHELFGTLIEAESLGESGTRGGAAVAGVAAVKGGSIYKEEITKLYVITWKMEIYIFFRKVDLEL